MKIVVNNKRLQYIKTKQEKPIAYSKKKLVVIKPRPRTTQGINIINAIIIGSNIVQQ